MDEDLKPEVDCVEDDAVEVELPTPIVAEAACDVEVDHDEADLELLTSLIEMCERRKLAHRKRVKQMRLFEELWEKAIYTKRMLLSQ